MDAINKSIPNTVADFYNTVEDEFTADEDKPAKIEVEIKNKGKDDFLQQINFLMILTVFQLK